jgi:hypothetical protein
MNATMTSMPANRAGGGENQGRPGASTGERLDGWKAIAGVWAVRSFSLGAGRRASSAPTPVG